MSDLILHIIEKTFKEIMQNTKKPSHRGKVAKSHKAIQ